MGIARTAGAMGATTRAAPGFSRPVLPGTEHETQWWWRMGLPRRVMTQNEEIL